MLDPIHCPDLLAGRTVIVTGGGQGLGLAIAQRLAAAGARLFLLDLDGQRALDAATGLPGPGHQGLPCDITNAAARTQAVDRVLSAAGRIDVLVNNAGIQWHSPAEEIDEERWRRLLDVNLNALVFMSRDVGKIMLAQRAGAIVNIASIGAELGMPRRAPYIAAKAAVLGVTRTLGVEWASRGVRVNAVSPGYCMTALLEASVRTGTIDEKRIRHRIPMGRLAEPDEIGRAVLFLCSPLASYITGQNLVVDGGYVAFGAPEDASA